MSVWLAVSIVFFVFLKATLLIGIPTVVLLLVLRHHRRKTVELWLQTVERGALPPPPPWQVAPQARAAVARAWALLGYPRR